MTGVVVGSLLAIFLASLGFLVSLFADSNRISLSQLPSGAQKGWARELLLRINPITAGEHYVGKIVVNGHSWTEDVSWLTSPVIAAPLFAFVAAFFGARAMRLSGGASG
ncbi:hypothetical protein BH18ACT12_BH18ACT12_24120 [soil metagenome]